MGLYNRLYEVAVHGETRPVIPYHTGSDDSEQFHCVVRKCHQSARLDGTCCKGSNPSLSTTISHVEEAVDIG
jgi:hypothetical protein